MSEHIDNLEIGKWYQQANGNVGQCQKAPANYGNFEFVVNEFLYRRSKLPLSPSSYIVREVQPPVPVLPFQLEAGRKYCTQNPDGSEGPVVTLERECRNYGAFWKSRYPYVVSGSAYQIPVGLDGVMISSNPDAAWSGYKPPTIAEQLIDWRANQSSRYAEEFDRIVAKVKALEAK